MKLEWETLMEFWRTKVGVIAIVLLMAALGIGSHLYLKDDNSIEEATEVVIERELGLNSGSIDLSPSSQESSSPL